MTKPFTYITYLINMITAQNFMEGLKLNRVTKVGANFSAVEKLYMSP